MKWLTQLRKDYSASTLNIEQLNKNPFKEFDIWFKRAIKAEKHEPNAMALATTSKSGKPSNRFVLLKNYSEEGFVFYSNYKSKKSIQINESPFAALVFFWPTLQQQVRIEGEIELLNNEESDKYFDSRPNGSKIGAWASPQSKIIPSREYLEEIKNKFIEKSNNTEIKRPDFWGGFILKPSLIEFWQGRQSRLHDRFEYSIQNQEWIINRLAP